MASLRTLVAFLTLCAVASFAQHTHEQGGASMPEMQHEGMHHDVTQHAEMQHDETGRAESFLMGESSGTGFQTQSWPMPMLMTRPGKWNLMWMGQAYLVETQQS